MTKKNRRDTFRFKPGFTIGGVAAETDPLLATCFVSTDCFEAASNTSDPRCAIIGRAGTGKTAILDELMRRYEGNTIKINPEALAFQFLGKSEMIRALRTRGVNLDYFYKLLWRHILVVEILKHYFPAESNQSSRISQLADQIKKRLKPDPAEKRAVEYLDQWDATVLQPTNERIQEIHNNLGKRIRAKIGFYGGWLALFGLTGGIDGEIASNQEVTERVHIAQEVVSHIQVEDLNKVRDYVGSTILDDPQKPCYVLIDDLDRFVVDDPLVHDLIRGLILEIYDWKKIKNLKVIYALRNNILNRIESEFKTRSYQKEKLEDQRYYIDWTREELIELVNRRLWKISQGLDFVNNPTLREILPKHSSRQPSGLVYILERTSNRPRDIIDYINRAGMLCIGKERISIKVLQEVEDSYSQGRLAALYDEWRVNYPELDIITKLLRRYPPRFPISFWSENDLMDILTDRRIPKGGWLETLCQEYEKDYALNPSYALNTCIRRLVKLLFEVGIVGVKISEGGTIRYCHTGDPLLSDVELDGDPQVVVHPMFHRALGINPWITDKG
ncbi:MAG: P-loop ATPase, Sll1717 family [Chloroflexota bacterium]